MSSFIIEGQHTLQGNITPQGAKNEALQILCAVLLAPQKTTIHNLPKIIDVLLLIDLLENFGVKINWIDKNSCEFDASDIDINFLYHPNYKEKATKIRGSVMLAGPLLARFGKAFIPKPGGDKIGRRRIDTHIIGLHKLGASYKFDEDLEGFVLETNQLKANYLMLDEPSVTGTANIVMAAIKAEGKTTIYNAACEPYLQQLCAMLNSMGAKIKGIGSNLLEIEGVNTFTGTTHTILPDMIEVGSFIGLAAMTQSNITIKNCGVKHLGIIPEKFMQLGIDLKIKEDDIEVPAQELYTIQSYLEGGILTIYDNPWPGLTPDLLSILLVVATQAQGSVLIHQKMFESRLFFTDKLIDMGAQIILCDPHRATVVGLARKFALKGITMASPDIRAGVALLIAALSAKGKSTIQNIEQIDRGYENIEQRLQALGANILRV